MIPSDLIAEQIEKVIYQFSGWFVLITLVGAIAALVWKKYEPIIEWYLFKWVERVKGRRLNVNLMLDEEVVAEVEYDQFSREVRVVIERKDTAIITPKYDSEPEKLIRYLVANPNRDISAKELRSEVQLSPKADLSDLVTKLRFTGELRKLFFKVSKNTVRLNTPIKRKQIRYSSIQLEDIKQQLLTTSK